ncbi:MAG: phenylalanine-4-hydroxylase [Acidobacteriota bacterium]|jgi:phenylalanine-4-hydroxylase|nr:phenylalanine-4-hydroxylase [Acidobacteriota bacterium]
MKELRQTKQPPQTPLRDHADARPVAAGAGASVGGDRNLLVQLDPDHPGFRDAGYRARRNHIAQLAITYKSGEAIPGAPYSEEEHALWRTVRAALDPRHGAYACAEYLEAARRLALPRERIPQLAEVSARVARISSFRLEPIAGLVEARVFLESLAGGVFLCTQYIRHHSTPLYTPEPDVVHELLGHAATLASPRLAQLNRLFGEAVRRTASDEDFERLARVYWYTVEFGVLKEDGETKAYGTGLLSSAGELEAMSRADVRPLDLDAASRLEYDPTRFQPVLFCADSFDAMCERLTDFLLNWG